MTNVSDALKLLDKELSNQEINDLLKIASDFSNNCQTYQENSSKYDIIKFYEKLIFKLDLNNLLDKQLCAKFYENLLDVYLSNLSSYTVKNFKYILEPYLQITKGEIFKSDLCKDFEHLNKKIQDILLNNENCQKKWFIYFNILLNKHLITYLNHVIDNLPSYLNILFTGKYEPINVLPELIMQEIEADKFSSVSELYNILYYFNKDSIDTKYYINKLYAQLYYVYNEIYLYASQPFSKHTAEEIHCMCRYIYPYMQLITNKKCPFRAPYKISPYLCASLLVKLTFKFEKPEQNSSFLLKNLNKTMKEYCIPPSYLFQNTLQLFKTEKDVKDDNRNLGRTQEEHAIKSYNFSSCERSTHILKLRFLLAVNEGRTLPLSLSEKDIPSTNNKNTKFVKSHPKISLESSSIVFCYHCELNTDLYWDTGLFKAHKKRHNSPKKPGSLHINGNGLDNFFDEDKDNKIYANLQFLICCRACRNPFVFSFLSFEILPLALIDSSSNQLNIDAMYKENNPSGDYFRVTKLFFDSQNNEINYYYFQNKLPGISLYQCQNCENIFYSEEWEFYVIQHKECPFCHVYHPYPPT